MLVLLLSTRRRHPPLHHFLDTFQNNNFSSYNTRCVYEIVREEGARQEPAVRSRRLGLTVVTVQQVSFFPRNYVLIGDIVEEIASQVSTPVLIIFEIIVRSAQVKNLLKDSLLSRQVAEAPIR